MGALSGKRFGALYFRGQDMLQRANFVDFCGLLAYLVPLGLIYEIS